MDEFGLDGINVVVSNIIHPIAIVVILVATLFGSIGIWFSIMAASAFASLVPKHNKKNDRMHKRTAALDVLKGSYENIYIQNELQKRRLFPEGWKRL